ncbi:MAG: hypothetical protein U1C55_04600 [Smithellaceae bacterium]|nr:hypothetical protein [Smithellaceae bacterium]
MSEGKNRKIEVTLAGDAVRNGRVSVSLFAKTLQSVQEIVFQIAGARLKREMRGPVPAIIKAKCELFLIKTEHGSLNAVLELPGKEATLFPDEADFSEDIIEDTQQAIDAFLDVDTVKLEQILPHPSLRRRVISRICTIAPADGSDYSLSFRFNGGPQKMLVRPPSGVIKKLEALPDTFEKIAEPTIKFVEAKGMAQMEHGDIKKWVETHEVSELNLDPEHVWRPQKIKAKGNTFHLVHPIACVIEKQDDLLFSEDTNLGIIAYGETREDVMREFSNEFEVLWNVIAQEEDNLLTRDALSLKRKLIELVRKAEVHGDKEGAGD